MSCRYAGDGVIAYDYDVYDYETLASAIVVVGVAAFVGYVSSVPAWLLSLFGVA